MSDTTLKLRTNADLTGLRDYNNEMEKARRNLDALTTAARAYQAVKSAPTAHVPPAPTSTPGTHSTPGWQHRQQNPGRPSHDPSEDVDVTPSGEKGTSPAMMMYRAGAFVARGGRAGGRAAVGANRAGGSFIQNAASTAIGVGLGSSLTGFFLQSGQKYMELSKILTTVKRRFREAGDNAAYYGQALGYTLAESSMLVESLGEQTDSVSRLQTQRILGFARQQGMDPHAAVRGIGGMERVLNRNMTDDELAAMLSRADRQGMSQGRFGEYLEAQTRLAQSQFSQTGHANFENLSWAASIPGAVFGPTDPRAQGSAGVDFTERFGRVLSGDTNPAMKTFMMRAMGYGTERGPDYIEMRERMEAGAHDPRNVVDMFNAFSDRGMGRGAQYRALESISGGSLKAHELRALVDTLGTNEGLNRFVFANDGTEADRDDFLAGLSPSEQSAFHKMGFAGLGTLPGRISMGEEAAVQMEGLQMSVGQPVARGILDMRESVISVAGGIKNLLGLDLGTLLTDLTGAVRNGTSAWEESTRVMKNFSWINDSGLFGPDEPDPNRQGVDDMMGGGF